MNDTKKYAKFIDSGPGMTRGRIYEIVKECEYYGEPFVHVVDNSGIEIAVYRSRFKFLDGTLAQLREHPNGI